MLLLLLQMRHSEIRRLYIGRRNELRGARHETKVVLRVTKACSYVYRQQRSKSSQAHNEYMCHNTLSINQSISLVCVSLEPCHPLPLRVSYISYNPLRVACNSLEVIFTIFFIYSFFIPLSLSPPWPSGLKRWNQTLVPVVRARFEPRCGRPHFAPTRSGVRVCGRNRTEAREREWAEGTVSSLPGTLNVRIKFCHSTGIARSGGGVRASTTSYA